MSDAAFIGACVAALAAGLWIASAAVRWMDRTIASIDVTRRHEHDFDGELADMSAAVNRNDGMRLMNPIAVTQSWGEDAYEVLTQVRSRFGSMEGLTQAQRDTLWRADHLLDGQSLALGAVHLGRRPSAVQTIKCPPGAFRGPR